MKNKYVIDAYEKVCERCKGEEQFLNTVREVFESLDVFYDKHPEFENKKYLERISEPDRVIEFRVEWLNDLGGLEIFSGCK